MFHWPLVSAFVGISTNLFFILVISVLSWYHWGDAVWIEKRVKQRIARSRRKLHSVASDSAPSDGDDRSVGAMLADDLRRQRNTGSRSESLRDTMMDEEFSSAADLQLDDESDFSSDVENLYGESDMELTLNDRHWKIQFPIPPPPPPPPPNDLKRRKCP